MILKLLNINNCTSDAVAHCYVSGVFVHMFLYLILDIYPKTSYSICCIVTSEEKCLVCIYMLSTSQIASNSAPMWLKEIMRKFFPI